MSAEDDTEANAENQQEDPTELVMRKNGDYVEIWAVVDGHQVFSAAPPAIAAGSVIKAAVETWLKRGWEAELTDLVQEDDKSKGGWFR